MIDALGPILGTTYGLVIYQEQVMEIAQKLAGYTLGNADLLRRAMGKKKKEVLDAEYVPFSEGMKAKGFNEASIAALWGVLVPFSDYAFNKAHTAAYGLVSYWTAYLKANYPAEYMAALLTSVGDDKDKSALYLGECRRMGIKVLPPDVNDSIGRFAAVGTDIRFGLQAIRNVGHNVVEAIIAAREEKGRFTSFKDFLSKCPAVVCNKRTIESLIKAGAFDGLGRVAPGPAAGARGLRRHLRRHQAPGGHRPGLAVRRLRRRRRRRVRRRLLGAAADPGRRVGQDDAARLRARDARPLRLRPPAVRHRARARPHADTSIASLMGDEDGKPEGAIVTIAGLITGLQVKRTKKGDLWAIATVEDLEGAIECLFFPQPYMTVAHHAPARTPSSWSGPGQPARRHPVDLRPGAHPARRLRGPARAGRGDHGRPTARPRRRSRSSSRVLAYHPGTTEVHVRLQPARALGR